MVVVLVLSPPKDSGEGETGSKGKSGRLGENQRQKVTESMTQFRCRRLRRCLNRKQLKTVSNVAKMHGKNSKNCSKNLFGNLKKFVLKSAVIQISPHVHVYDSPIFSLRVKG